MTSVVSAWYYRPKITFFFCRCGFYHFFNCLLFPEYIWNLCRPFWHVLGWTLPFINTIVILNNTQIRWRLQYVQIHVISVYNSILQWVLFSEHQNKQGPSMAYSTRHYKQEKHNATQFYWKDVAFNVVIIRETMECKYLWKVNIFWFIC